MSPIAKRWIRYFLAIFIPLTMLIGGVIVVIYTQETRAQKKVIEEREIANIEVISQAITAEFGAIRSDLLFLSDHHGLRAYREGGGEYLPDVFEDFLAFAVRKAVYDQIRYLDEFGMEVVRINYNAGNPVVVLKDKLQNKGERYYVTDVTDATEIDAGKVFVSPLDLNIEGGEIEQPLKPMIRFGTPVFDEVGQHRGIVLLNYLGQNIFDRIDAASRSAGVVMLLNPGGYFLRGESPDQEWGFMYEARSGVTFESMYPDASAALASSNTGLAELDDGLFVTATVQPLVSGDETSGGVWTAAGESSGLLDNSEYVWTIVSHIPSEALHAGVLVVRSSLIQLFLVLVTLVAIGSHVVASLLARQRMSRGELERFAAELERSNKELDDFARIASHDLQEPLRKVAVFGDRLKINYADKLGEQGKDYIERMQSATGRMGVLIEDLLKYSRVTTKAQPFQRVDLNKVVSGVMCDLEVRIDEVQGRVEVGDLPDIDADSLQMRQLFQNLVGNALKFHRADVPPVVSIEATAPTASQNGSGPMCQIVVADNGIGFDQEYAERIFGTFERLWGRNEFEGTGVGLSICRKIVERHGGTIIATSAQGEGATFTITLPLEQKAA